MLRICKIKKLYICLGISLFILFTLTSCSKDSAYRKGEYIILNGIKYEETSGAYGESKTKICKCDGYTLYEVVGCDDRNYIAVRSWIDNYLYVRSDLELEYNIITEVYIEHKKLSDEQLINTISEIKAEYENADLVNVSYNDMYLKGRPIYLSYDNNPIGDVYVGIIGHIEDKWYIVKNEEGMLLDEEHIKVLSQYIE